jgi:cupin 2 domain-containing protein
MNIFDTPPPHQGEIFELLYKNQNIRIEHITSSDTLPAMIYDQDEDEWVIVAEGMATLLIEGKEKRLNKGDHLFIPAHQKHQIIECANGTHWIAVHIKNLFFKSQKPSSIPRPRVDL